MYIANTTKQNFIHQFRLPEENAAQYLHLTSGQQREIGAGWTEGQRAAVVQQLERYGARDAKTVRGKLANFSGTLYSFDKPINLDAIHEGHDKVVEDQSKRSASELTKAALGLDRSMRDKRTGKRSARATTLEVTQDDPVTGRRPDDAVDFSVTVSPDGSDNVKLPV